MHDTSLPLPETGLSAFAIGPLRGHTGFRLTGEADFTVRDRLRAALAALAADGAREIHLDLAGLGFIDVCCTRELIAIDRASSRRAPRRVLSARLDAAYHRHPSSGGHDRIHRHPQVRSQGGRRPSGAGHVTLAGAGDTRGSAGARPHGTDLGRARPHQEAHRRTGRRPAGCRTGRTRARTRTGPGPGPRAAWAALAGFLGFHVAAAGEIAYRPLAGTAPGAVAVIAHAAEADADIRAAVGEAQLARPGSRAWHMAVQAACSAARSHIACVESDPLSYFRHRTAPTVRRALGRQWVAFMAARALDEAARLRSHRPSRCRCGITVYFGSAAEAIPAW